MATGSGVNQGKTAFLEEFLPDNRDADLEAVKRAWNAAGNEGTISESLLGKIRTKLGLTGRKGTNGRANEEVAGPAAKVKARSSTKGAKGKARKAEEARSQPNGREGDTGPSRSAFVGEVLGREPGANLSKVNDAWASAGHDGAISPSIYYKVKRERGLTGEGAPPAPVKPEKSEAGPSPVETGETPQLSNGLETAPASLVGGGSGATGGLGRVVDEVEAGIDDLMFTLRVNGGMPEVEAALRAARRLLTRSTGV